MWQRVKKLLGFPYPAEYEQGFDQHTVRMMYKPLLIIVFLVLVMFFMFVIGCQLWPDVYAPPTHIQGVFYIHLSFLAFTFVILVLSVMLRRRLYERPKTYIALCNAYAMGICLWSSVLSAYADYSDLMFTAFVYVSMCVSLVSLYKPLLAILAYSGNYIIYALLVLYFSEAGKDLAIKLFNAGFAALLSIVISTVIYRFRASVYYGRLVITHQNDEIKKFNEQLLKLVYLDELTDLYNRRYFEEKLPDQMAEALSSGKAVCGMMLDVDHFKAYNDHYGHQAGDLCLRRIADIMRTTASAEGAVVVRYGGEEFFLMCPITDDEKPMRLAEHIRGAVADESIANLASKLGHITVSIGVAVCRAADDDCSLKTLTHNADEALYQSKETGRNKATRHETL